VILIADKIKLLWHSDSIHVPTGYGRVTKEILTRINKKKFDVNHFGKQTIGQPHEVYGIMCYTIGNHKEGADVLPFHMRSIKPDILITLDDMWMHDWLNKMDISPTKHIQYFPSDGCPLPYGSHVHMLKADVNVAMSKYGKRVAEEYDFHEGGKFVKLTSRLTHPIEYIPHGVTTNVFKPLKEKEREELKKGEGLEGKFVIGCVSRNQPRKMMPRMFRAFAEFYKKHKDAELYCHMDPLDPQGYNLRNIAMMLRIPKVRFTKMHSYKYGVDDTTLNHVYNLMDIHTIPTSGEGFGLTILEAMSAGIPNVITDYTTTKELVADTNSGIVWISIKL
jgi:glycosyltransferase involved in cell wall biosynthesis